MKHQTESKEIQYKLTVNGVDFGLVWIDPAEFKRLGGYTFAEQTKSFSRMGKSGLEVYMPRKGNKNESIK